METVPIVLCTDDNYVPFMSVTMQSVMENGLEGCGVIGSSFFTKKLLLPAWKY